MKLLKNNIGIISILLAAIFYAICVPCTKLIQNHIAPVFLGGLLYMGAGLGILFTTILKKSRPELSLTKKDFPFLIAMVLLDISAIISLIYGISITTASSVSLLLNFELAATSFIAFFIFKEFISKKTLIAIIFITVSSLILSFEKQGNLTLNIGALLVLLSAVFWGFENNCTKMLSSKDTRQITIIKGCFSGFGSLIIADFLKESVPEIQFILIALFLGFISYGISVALYIYAQRFLGAAKTGALYSITPFLGVLFSYFILKEIPNLKFYIALIIMVFSSILIIRDTDNS